MGIQVSDIEILENLIKDINKLEFQDEDNLNYMLKKTEMIIRNISGPSSKYLKEINSILFYPYEKRSSIQIQQRIWMEGIKELSNICRIIIDEINIFRKLDRINQNINTSSKKVFIVHGKDVEVKEAVARVLIMLDIDPIILGERPNIGKTIIEKFEYYSDVQVAIILFTPDDIGGVIHEDWDNLKPRARQNVILELGFFLGKLDRTKIILIHKKKDDFEIPSDISGIVYIEFDDKEGWKMKLCQELVALGFDIDINKLVRQK